MKVNSKPGIFSLFSLIWQNREKIVEYLGHIQTVAKHLKNLIDDLKDDGKLNGSNVK